MRYLILSDIHSNHEALSAVLAHVKRKRWDKAIVLGDVVGYGANPNQAVDMVRALRPLVAIRGNHDKVCSGVENGEMFNRVALHAAMWTRKRLTPANQRWLHELPQGLQDAIAEGMKKDIFEKLREDITGKVARKYLRNVPINGKPAAQFNAETELPASKDQPVDGQNGPNPTKPSRRSHN